MVATETARGSFKSQDLGMTIKSALAFPGTSLLDKTPVIVVAVTSAEMDTDGLAAYYDRRPIRSDGSIHRIARAWAVRSRVPR